MLRIVGEAIDAIASRRNGTSRASCGERRGRADAHACRRRVSTPESPARRRLTIELGRVETRLTTCVPPAITHALAEQRRRPRRRTRGDGPASRSDSTTGLRSTPMPSISHSTTSPSLSERLGSMNSPQPHGVPVRITSPGSSVNECEQKLISSATPKIISLVLESCMTSPLTRVCSLRFCGSSSSTTLRAERAERVQALGAHPLAVGELQVARGDVVGDRVAAHVLERVGLGHVARRLADDRRELDLPVHALGELARDPDLLAVVDQRRRELAEHERLLRRLGPRLAHVVHVVEPDRHDLARTFDHPFTALSTFSRWRNIAALASSASPAAMAAAIST